MKIKKEDLGFLKLFTILADSKMDINDKLSIKSVNGKIQFRQLSYCAEAIYTLDSIDKDLAKVDLIVPIKEFVSFIRLLPKDSVLNLTEKGIILDDFIDKEDKYQFDVYTEPLPSIYRFAIKEGQTGVKKAIIKDVRKLFIAEGFVGMDAEQLETVVINTDHFVSSDQVVTAILDTEQNISEATATKIQEVTNYTLSKGHVKELTDEEKHEKILALRKKIIEEEELGLLSIPKPILAFLKSVYDNHRGDNSLEILYNKDIKFSDLEEGDEEQQKLGAYKFEVDRITLTVPIQPFNKTLAVLTYPKYTQYYNHTKKAEIDKVSFFKALNLMKIVCSQNPNDRVFLTFNKDSVTLENKDHNNSRQTIKALVDEEIVGVQPLVSCVNIQKMVMSLRGEKLFIYSTSDKQLNRTAIRLEDENHDIHLIHFLLRKDE